MKRTSLSRERFLAIVLPAVIAAIAVAAGLVKTFGAPVWVYVVIPVTGLIATVVGLLLQQVQTETNAQKEREETFSRHVRWPLPRVSDTKPSELGVKESAIARELGGPSTPYAGRDKDAELDRALRDQAIVVVVGESGAGKSRTAYEAARRNFGESRLLVPTRSQSLREALSQGLAEALGKGHFLLWLDDLEGYLVGEGFTLEVFEQLQGPARQCIALATLRSQERERILRDRELSRPGRAILRSDRTQIIGLSRTLSAGERENALKLYTGAGLAKALETHGLGEYFVSGPDLVDRFEDAKASCPEGAAVIAAAIDWRRAGLTRPIPESLLKTLHALYVERFVGETVVGEERFESGLQWARTPIYATARLLLAREGGFEANDYVLDYVQGEGLASDPIPGDVWECLIETLVHPGEVVSVGIAAHEQAQSALAQRALEKAIASGDPEWGPKAIYSLGVILAEREDAVAAEKTFREAMAAGDPAVATRAAVGLGIVFSERGDVAGAQKILQEAIASGDANELPSAALNLGVVLGKRGDQRGAEKAYRKAIASGDAYVVPQANLALGSLLEDLGDDAGAESAYRGAMASGDEQAAPWAAFRLGILLAQRGDATAAEEAYREAIASGDAEVVPMATVNLGLVLAELEDEAGAEEAFREAIASSDPYAARSAVYNLGNLLANMGDEAGAERAFREAIASGDVDVAPMATVNLGKLLAERGDHIGAENAYSQAIASGHDDVAPRAMVNLGILLAEGGDRVGAESAFRQAIASDHTDEAPRAMVNLGILLAEGGDRVGAERAFLEAIASDNMDEARRASINLEILRGHHIGT